VTPRRRVMFLPRAALFFLPLCASTVVDGRLSSGGASLWYRVHRPELLFDVKRKPLLVLHGGPQVPSDYLFPLSKLEDRAVVFYDQAGCGRSDGAKDPSQYSVDASVSELLDVTTHLGLGGGNYHLYGQSWGGLLAYSFLSRPDAGRCPCSLTLSNSPASVALVEAEATRLIEEQGSVEQFMAAHNCRLPGEQPELAAAYAHAGTTWRGSGAISGLEVDADALGCIRCPALVLRGEHDFVTEACVAPWSALPEATFVTLAGTSHHALLEDTGAYLSALGGFLCESDASSGGGGASGGGGGASGIDLEIDLQRVRLQMREEEDSLTGDFDLDDSDTWAAETELLRARTAKSEAEAIKEARKEKYPLTGTALYGGVLFAAAVLGAQYAVKEGLVPAELSLVALALTGPALAASGSLANWRGEDVGESAGLGQKRTYTENLQTFFRLKDETSNGEDEGNGEV
jgi:proline iminopeptidase